jgi:phosphopantetheinyl transferase (holo-ACP synthase)
MNTLGSPVYDLSGVCRLDALPCEPGILADLILSPREREQWTSMRAVEKRRHEWLLGRCVAKEAVRLLLERDLDLHLSPEEIEIVPDPYGRPLVSYCDVAQASACSGTSVPPNQ